MLWNLGIWQVSQDSTSGKYIKGLAKVSLQMRPRSNNELKLHRVNSISFQEKKNAAGLIIR